MRRRRARVGRGAVHVRRGGAAAALLLVALLSPGPDASAVPLQPEELVVSNGGEAWRPDNGFGLRWRIPVQAGETLVAVHYRVRAPAGAVVIGETRIGQPVPTVEGIKVPNIPGAYRAEVWLEDSNGAQGAPAAAWLRFDNLRPANVEPRPKPGWIGRTEQPYTLRIDRPAEPHPVSGIRGYAIAIDRSPAGSPCLLADRCSEAETDLHGGSASDALSIVELPEGTSYAHAVAVSGSGMRSGLVGHAMLRVDKTDPVTTLSGAPEGWTNQSAHLTATAVDALSGMWGAGEGESPFTAIRVDAGVPTTTPGGSVSTAVIESGIHTISYYARDAAGNVNDGAYSNGQPNRPPATAVVRIDRDAPRVAFLNSQLPAHPDIIRAQVADPLAGPAGGRGSIAVRLLGSGDRFEPLPTEAGGVLRARWDSDAYPPGRYEFRAIGYDAAGNSSSATVRLNGSRMVLSNPLKVPTVLSAGLAPQLKGGCGRRREDTGRCRQLRDASPDPRPALTVPYGRGALLSGRLTASRAPMPGEKVIVIQRFPAGSGIGERTTAVATRADGTFVAPLAPGPSREVTAVFAGGQTLARARSEALPLAVGAGVRLGVSASTAAVGGAPVVFRGRLLSHERRIAVGERTVQLQFRVPGMPWTEFRSLQTGARGGFSFPYRFSDDDSRGVRFRFRAFVPAQIDWPYAPAGSPPVTVRGR